MAEPTIEARPASPVAEVIVLRREDGHLEFLWRGDLSWPVLVSHELEAQEPDLLGKLPWPLRKVADIPAQGISVYERVTS